MFHHPIQSFENISKGAVFTMGAVFTIINLALNLGNIVILISS